MRLRVRGALHAAAFRIARAKYAPSRSGNRRSYPASSEIKRLGEASDARQWAGDPAALATTWLPSEPSLAGPPFEISNERKVIVRDLFARLRETGETAMLCWGKSSHGDACGALERARWREQRRSEKRSVAPLLRRMIGASAPKRLLSFKICRARPWIWADCRLALLSQEARKLTLSGARDFGTSRRHSGRSASPVGSPIPVDLVRRNYEVNVFLPLQLTQGVVQRWVREGKAQGKKVAFTSSMGGCSHRRTGALPQPRRARVHDVDVHRTGAAGVLDCLDAFFGGRSALIDQYPRHSAIPSRTSIAAIRPIIESLANVCKFALLRAYARRPSWLIGIRFGTL